MKTPVDRTNPCVYLRIVERDTTGYEFLLFGIRNPGEVNPAGEVDYRSTIHIGYSSPPDVPGLAIAISARVRGNNSSRPLEVPGYSMVGDTTTSTYALQVQLMDQVPVAVFAFNEALIRIQDSIRAVTRSNEEARNTRLTELKNGYAAANSIVNALIVDSAQKANKSVSVRAQADSVNRGDTLHQSSPVLQTQLAAASEHVELANLRLVNARIAARDAQLALVNYRTEIGDEAGTDPKTVGKLVQILHDNFKVRSFVLSLNRGVFRPFLPSLALAANQDLPQLKNLLETIVVDYSGVDTIASEKTTDKTREKHSLVSSQLLRHLSDLSEALQINSKEDGVFARISQSTLHTSDINLKQAGVEPGQTVIFIVTTTDITGFRRSTEIPIAVGRFGIVRDVSDSFIFLKREKIPGRLDSVMVADKIAQYARNRGIQRQLVSPQVDVPIRDATDVTPGATFGWTYYSRQRQNRIWRVLRFLQPGFGVNASFPTYSNNRITIAAPDSLPATATQADIDAAAKNPVAKLSGPSMTEKEPLGIGGGFIVALFDNSLAYTYGWNLTTSSHYRRYSGFAISFLSLAQKAKTTYNNLVGGK